MASMRSSDHLHVGNLYTKEQLSSLFSISDATIDNDIFKPKAHSSVWLFITEHKTAERSQFGDFLQADVLRIQGYKDVRRPVPTT